MKVTYNFLYEENSHANVCRNWERLRDRLQKVLTISLLHR